MAARAKHLIQSSTLLQEIVLMFSEDYFHLLPVNIVFMEHLSSFFKQSQLSYGIL
jgi:hypothetical protein